MLERAGLVSLSPQRQPLAVLPLHGRAPCSRRRRRGPGALGIEYSNAPAAVEPADIKAAP